MNVWFIILYSIAWPFFCLFHPVRAVGREHIPEGAAVICPNHSSLCDPLLVAFALHRKNRVRVMAKAELMKVPVLGWLLKKAGIFGVHRGETDVAAIKIALQCLKEGTKLLLFPQGTRVRAAKGEVSDPKTGAALLAVRAGVPILPVYVPEKKNWFSRTSVIIGEAYMPEVASRKGTPEEYEAITQDLMARIAALGAQVA